MSEPNQTPGCRAFARELADHIDAVRAGKTPTHAAECAACAARLRLSVGLGGMAAKRPTLPAQLSNPKMLASVFERAVEASEASPLGQALGDAMRVEPLGDRLPWPAQTLGAELRQQVQAVPHREPAKIRPFVPAGVDRRALLRRRFAAATAVAASVALLAVFGWREGRSEGTTEGIRIVFVPVSELPAVMHPTAVLRQAVVR